MQKIKKIIEVIWQHVVWVWEFIPVLMLLEVWSLVRVAVILATVAILIAKNVWKDSALAQMIADFFGAHM